MACLTLFYCGPHPHVCIAGNTLVLHGGLFRKPSPPGQGAARGRKRRRIPFAAAGPLQPGNLSDLVAASMPQLSLGLGFGVQTLESIAFATRGASADIQQDDAMWALRRPEPSCALLHDRLAGLCRAVDSCTFAAWCPSQVCGTWDLDPAEPGAPLPADNRHAVTAATLVASHLVPCCPLTDAACMVHSCTKTPQPDPRQLY